MASAFHQADPSIPRQPLPTNPAAVLRATVTGPRRCIPPKHAAPDELGQAAYDAYVEAEGDTIIAGPWHTKSPSQRAQWIAAGTAAVRLVQRRGGPSRG